MTNEKAICMHVPNNRTALGVTKTGTETNTWPWSEGSGLLVDENKSQPRAVSILVRFQQHHGKTSTEKNHKCHVSLRSTRVQMLEFSHVRSGWSFSTASPACMCLVELPDRQTSTKIRVHVFALSDAKRNQNKITKSCQRHGETTSGYLFFFGRLRFGEEGSGPHPLFSTQKASGWTRNQRAEWNDGFVAHCFESTQAYYAATGELVCVKCRCSFLEAQVTETSKTSKARVSHRHFISSAKLSGFSESPWGMCMFLQFPGRTNWTGNRNVDSLLNRKVPAVPKQKMTKSRDSLYIFCILQ